MPTWVTAIGEEPYAIEWIRQLGTSEHDDATGIALDNLGHVYVTGYTGGSLGGPLSGGLDAFLAKYDDTGDLLWVQQLGSSDWDRPFGASTDGQGNIYIAGLTHGSLGGPLLGGLDPFLSKYDPDGDLLWTRQLSASRGNGAYGVSADAAGNVYITGNTEGSIGLGEAHAGGFQDGFLAKYDPDGTLLWARHYGTSDYEWSTGVSVDNVGSVYMTGYTQTVFGQSFSDRDAFLAKYDTEGNLLWTQGRR